MSTVNTPLRRPRPRRPCDRARRSRAVRPGHGVRRRHSRIHIIYAVAGLGIFGAFTIYDFNRLRRASADGAVVIAASILLDIFNVFLLVLDLFGGQRDQPVT